MATPAAPPTNPHATVTSGPTSRSSHVLRPNHVALCMLLYGVYYLHTHDERNKWARLPAGFQLKVVRLLLREVAEVVQPIPCVLIIEYLEDAILLSSEDEDHKTKTEREICRRWLDAMREELIGLQNLNSMSTLFSNLQIVTPYKDDERDPNANPTIARRSLFGLFIRRSYLSFVKLSIPGVNTLIDEYAAWLGGASTSQAAYEDCKVENMIAASILLPTYMDKQTYVQTAPLEKFEKSVLVGNEVQASDSLRTYFEQHFHEGLESGYRQHALLQLCRVHYLREEYTETRRLLEEAIAVSRVKGDRITLMHCMALLHRLPPKEPDSKPIINEVQPHLNPLEVLNDVRKLLDEDANQPLSVVFRRIAEAMALQDHFIGTQGHVPAERDQYAAHLVKAIAWSTAGRDSLGEVHREIVMNAVPLGTDDDTKLYAMLWKAYQVARSGKYDEGLTLLLNPGTWGGISLSQYPVWAAEVWHVLALRASRQGMHRIYREVLAPNQPQPTSPDGNGSGTHPRQYFFGQYGERPKGLVTGNMFDVLHFRKVDQSTAAVEKLLVSLFNAELQGRFDHYRIGMMLLADVGMEFGMTKRCLRIMEDIMPQIHASDDVEQRGFAFFMLARCLLATYEGSIDGIRKALPYTEKAEAEYERLQAHVPLSHIQCFSAMLYHNLGDTVQRDAAAARNLKSEKLADQMSGLATDKMTIEVWQLVKEIGAALALRA